MNPRRATRTALVVALAAGAVGLLGPAASADGGACPSGAGWTRVGAVPEGTTSVTVTAPAGTGIVETCLWTGSEAQVYAYDPAAAHVVIAPVGIPAEGEPALAVVEYAYRVITLEPVPAAEPAPEPAPPVAPAPVPVPEPAALPEPQPAAAAPAPARPAAASSQVAAPSPAPAADSAAPVVAQEPSPRAETSVGTSVPRPSEPRVSALHASAVMRSPSTADAGHGGTGSGLTAAALGALVLLAGGTAAVVTGRRRVSSVAAGAPA